MSEQFYVELNSAIKAPACFLVFVFGNFNSKWVSVQQQLLNQGRISAWKHVVWKPAMIMVKHWSNSWHCTDFACNTAFQHTSCKATRTDWLKDQNAPSGLFKTVAIYTHIDFVLCILNGLKYPCCNVSSHYYWHVLTKPDVLSS